MSAFTSTPTNPRPQPAIAADSSLAWWSNVNNIALVAIAIGIVVGGLSLVGWLVNVPELRALGPATRASMNPMTAACFIATGCSMWLIVQADWRHSREVAMALAWFVVIVGAARLYGIVTGEPNGADQLLFPDAMAKTADGRHNRMSLNAAVNFFSLGSALLLHLRGTRFASGLHRALQASDVKQRLASQGLDTAVSTPEEFRKIIAADLRKWAKVVRDACIQPE